MCDLSIIFTIGASMLGAMGQIQQGNAANAAAQYQAQVAQMNAQMAEERAKDALERGKEEEQSRRRETAQLKGQQQAAMAANGLDLSFGTPLDLIVDTAVMGELDALTIRKNSYREERDYRQQANNFRSEAEMQKAAGKNAKRQSIFAAAGTVLGGFGDAYKGAKSNAIKFA